MKAFGEGFWERAGWMPDEFMMEMAANTTDPGLLEKIIGRLEQSAGGKLTATSLRLRARQLRGAPRLRELCLTVIRDFYVFDWGNTATGILAAEILAEQFAGDSKACTTLEGFISQEQISSALVIAVCAGWPDSRATKLVGEFSERSRLLLPAQCQLAALSLSPEEFVAFVSRVISKCQGSIWEFLPSCIRALTPRFERDTQVRELAFRRLETQSSSADKVNLPLFLRKTNEQPERLQDWMRSEIKRQSAGEHVADVALDLSTGTVCSVSHVLLDRLLV